ncbi:fructose-6-phosphate aldolase [Wolbachia pipientis]|uniref:Fructose-6-phosphate aldolase n=1 Tax=Wolbachia pipientis TaxID=955 RepID=A0A1E7QJ00_WOLPI|nr:fructose-6-phosphate aldolase [Wolbachia pipientis]OEY86435.1 fructose-6-phosphate aldolase [Wolbachia pipientis]
MEIFLDSADLGEIKECIEFIDGITTNPSLIAKAGFKNKYKDLIGEICSTVKGPVSVEVVAHTHTDMIKEGLALKKIADNIVIKLPLTYEGLIACKELSTKYNIKVNVTLCFSSGQALLAAKAGAYLISPFVGRLDDISHNGLSLIKDICTIYSSYVFNTKVLVASVRSPTHVIEAAKLGAQAITIASKILMQMIAHPLTDSGLATFEKDWNN